MSHQQAVLLGFVGSSYTVQVPAAFQVSQFGSIVFRLKESWPMLSSVDIVVCAEELATAWLWYLQLDNFKL
jgi:hypothetical protein